MICLYFTKYTILSQYYFMQAVVLNNKRGEEDINNVKVVGLKNLSHISQM